MKFEYKLSGVGWADGIIEVNFQEHNFSSEDLIKKYLELGDYIPHLTLGQTNFRLTGEEFESFFLRISYYHYENEQ